MGGGARAVRRVTSKSLTTTHENMHATAATSTDLQRFGRGRRAHHKFSRRGRACATLWAALRPRTAAASIGPQTSLWRSSRRRARMARNGSDRAEEALGGTLIEYDAFAPALRDHARGSRLDAHSRASSP